MKEKPAKREGLGSSLAGEACCWGGDRPLPNWNEGAAADVVELPKEKAGVTAAAGLAGAPKLNPGVGPAGWVPRENPGAGAPKLNPDEAGVEDAPTPNVNPEVAPTPKEGAAETPNKGAAEVAPTPKDGAAGFSSGGAAGLGVSHAIHLLAALSFCKQHVPHDHLSPWLARKAEKPPGLASIGCSSCGSSSTTFSTASLADTAAGSTELSICPRLA